jgi:predicted transcriptional regulator
MATSSTRRDRPQRYTARLEVHLDPGTQAKVKRLVTAFRRSWSEVIRHVLQWGLSHGQGWQVDRGRRPAPHHSFLRLEPELLTRADFPASWPRARRELTKRESTRSHDSRHYHTRYMMRLDDASTRKLDELAQHFNRSAADVLRQLIAQATPETFPQSWHLAAEERRQRRSRQADTGLGRA